MSETATLMISIGALSRACGVPIETLRTWERRYGFPHPERKPSGHRLYAMDGVSRLRRIAEAVAGGHRIGDVIHASEEQLDQLIGAMPEVPADALPPGQGAPAHPAGASTIRLAEDLEADIDQVLRAVADLDSPRMTRLLLSAWARLGPSRYLSDFVSPLLRRTGQAWAEGRIEIRHEHALSERLRDILRTVRLPFEERAQGSLVILATLPGEEHTLGLDMAALVFARTGWRSLYLGAGVPLAEIAATARHLRARAVGVSISQHAGAAETSEALRRLRAELPPAIALLAGGDGATDVPGVTRFLSLESLESWAGNSGDRRRSPSSSS